MITKRRVGVVLLAATVLTGALTGVANAAAEPDGTVTVCGQRVTAAQLKAAGIKPGQPIECGESVPIEPGIPAIPALPAIPAGQ
jgi:hypothetical protein